MNRRTARRDFLKTSLAAGMGAGYFISGRPAAAQSKSPNEKLHVAVIGPGGQGGYSLGGVASENVVALCDVDDQRAAAAFERLPKARKFKDFRRMFDAMGNQIDAVCVCTPDHTHAVAACAALRLDKHVYCEKPLAHTVHEVRAMRELAAKHRVATQMGTQIHAGSNYRRVVELVQTGAIGPVREVHVWCSTNWSGGERPAEMPEVPPHLDWDLWVGPAAMRPYHPTYVPYYWRKWWDFGGGTLADMGCHYIDLPYWALNLREPLTAAASGPPVHPETCPQGLTAQWTFPERQSLPKLELPPVTLTWYDAGLKPEHLTTGQVPDWNNGVLFLGEKGMLLADYNRHLLLPEAKFKDFQRPEPFIPDSIGHHREWIEACKTGSPTTCHFEYAGTLTETVLLGTVAYRVGEKLQWDAKNLKAANCPEADQYLRKVYRKGWQL